jgi:Cu/Ag efflux protein CusF
MIARFYHSLVMGLLPITLIACTNSGTIAAKQSGATPPVGVDLGPSGPVSTAPAGESHASHPQQETNMQIAHDGHTHVHGTGIVNAVNPIAHTVRLTHAPIPEIGWPVMTMDFLVAPSVDLSSIRPNRRVNFIMEEGQGGMYEIQAITPAEGG